MAEFLILGNSVEMMHIASEDICYISPDVDNPNYSNIFLTYGKKILVTMQLGKVYEAIKKYLPSDYKNFERIGRSLIVNKIYIISINLTKQQIILSDNRIDGFSAGYTTGYRDAQYEKEPLININVAPAKKILTAPKQHLKELKDNIENGK
ncbi:MAG: LytTR family transcriptional regulator DNA-binding domain-containing protein [Bacteroidales bacterium]|jgi:hypothetical protein|nr:LytTR family transcriptional regulator DNA-binding domain-containing protein [Bacteroidales bacterium]